MAETLAQLKKRLRDVMSRMTKKYGAAKLSTKDPNIELCLYLILRENWDFRKAQKSVRNLAERMVDWNELRVSFLSEIRDSIGFDDYRNIDEKVHRIRGFLKGVYSHYNRLTIDFAREFEFEEVRKVMAGIGPLGKANAYVFLQCLQDELDEVETEKSMTLVMSTETLRVATRLGLIKKTGSHNVGRKELSKIVPQQKYLELQNLFVRHGEQLCKSKSPQCKECFLNTICKFYKAQSS